MFDGNIWPVLLNDPLQKLMQDQTTAEGASSPTTTVWKQLCEQAGHITSGHVRSQRSGEIAEVSAVDDKNYVLLGSVLRTSSGQVAGAIVNLAEINSPNVPSLSTLRHQSGLQSNANSITQGDAVQPNPVEMEGYRHWVANRQHAQGKIAALSRRESEVLAFVADGQSNKRIAGALGVTTKTIEKHRANAALKLGAGSSAEMVRISVLAGHEIPHAYNVASN